MPVFCNGKEDEIRQQVRDKCERLNQIITDDKLRNCIKTRCENGKIKCCKKGWRLFCIGSCCPCKEQDVLGYNRQYFFGLFKSRTAVLCIDNIRMWGKQNKIGEMVIHEWAHSCCWHHGENKGVPGDSGYLNSDVAA